MKTIDELRAEVLEAEADFRKYYGIEDEMSIPDFVELVRLNNQNK